MLNAYQYSLDASRAYLAWSHEVEAENCAASTPPETGDLRQGEAADEKADRAKEQVASLWDPIASSQDLFPYASEEI